MQGTVSTMQQFPDTERRGREKMKKFWQKAGLISVLAAGLIAGSVTSWAEKVTTSGTGQGIDGDVVVEVTADENTIYDVQVVEENETVGIGSVAVEQLPQEIVDSNSILVDSVAGATVTSTAIMDAVRSALEEAGLDPEAFEK